VDVQVRSNLSQNFGGIKSPKAAKQIVILSKV
jgi:hypothetical protein